MAGLRKNKGFTIIELLLTTVLLTVIMASAISLYVAAQGFFNDLLTNSTLTSPAIAMETIVRKAQIANTIIYDGTNNQIKLRLDVNAASNPNRTPSDNTDDTWFKYRIIGSDLRWRTDSTPDTDVSASDALFDANLVLRPGSVFNLINPSGVATATVLNMVFITQLGTPSIDTTLQTSVAVGAMPKN